MTQKEFVDRDEFYHISTPKTPYFLNDNLKYIYNSNTKNIACGIHSISQYGFTAKLVLFGTVIKQEISFSECIKTPTRTRTESVQTVAEKDC